MAVSEGRGRATAVGRGWSRSRPATNCAGSRSKLYVLAAISARSCALPLPSGALDCSCWVIKWTRTIQLRCVPTAGRRLRPAVGTHESSRFGSMEAPSPRPAGGDITDGAHRLPGTNLPHAHDPPDG